MKRAMRVWLTGSTIALAAIAILSCATGPRVNAAGSESSPTRAHASHRPMILEPVFGKWPSGRRSDDAVFDFGVRALFNAGFEVGWVSEDDVFRQWLGDGEAAGKAALADGQRFDLAIREVKS